MSVLEKCSTLVCKPQPERGSVWKGDFLHKYLVNMLVLSVGDFISVIRNIDKCKRKEREMKLCKSCNKRFKNIKLHNSLKHKSNNTCEMGQTPPQPRKGSTAWWQIQLRDIARHNYRIGVEQGKADQQKAKPQLNIREIEDILHACARMTDSCAQLVCSYSTVMKGEQYGHTDSSKVVS